MNYLHMCAIRREEQKESAIPISEIVKPKPTNTGLQRYNINGTVKKDKGTYCKTCKNGNIYKDELSFKFDAFESDEKSITCVPCNTKYKIPKEQALIRITENYEPSNDDYITAESIKTFYSDFRQQLEEKAMNHIEARKQFEKTGTCPAHQLLQSNKVRTAAGDFVFNCCAVCKKARVVYEGVTYEDNLMKLVNWIAHKGIVKDRLNEVLKQEPLQQPTDLFKGVELNSKTDLFGDIFSKKEDLFKGCF